jgi:hypothetical protein
LSGKRINIYVREKHLKIIEKKKRTNSNFNLSKYICDLMIEDNKGD